MYTKIAGRRAFCKRRMHLCFFVLKYSSSPGVCVTNCALVGSSHIRDMCSSPFSVNHNWIRAEKSNFKCVIRYIDHFYSFTLASEVLGSKANWRLAGYAPGFTHVWRGLLRLSSGQGYAQQLLMQGSLHAPRTSTMSLSRCVYIER